jgi:GT2 family glycosyltransferase
MAFSEKETHCDFPLPADLDLRPKSRWPTRLSDATIAQVLATPLPTETASEDAPRTSVVVVTFDNLVFNRMCLESLLHTTRGESCEIIVVDNGSTDGTAEYLRQLGERVPRVHVILNGCNAGFAAANNRALSAARGEFIVLLNNDTIVPPGWLPALSAHLENPNIGAVGPVTNRSGNEAQIEVSYRTCGEFLAFAADLAIRRRGEQSELRTATMFCAAMRSSVFREVGPLDERFEIGLFEDDDYSMRIRAVGYRVVCAEDVFVHHFGQASIGKLAAAGAYGDLFHANRRRWVEKWHRAWEPYRLRPNPAYDAAVARIRAAALGLLPAGAKLLVVSKGDESLVDLPGIRAGHFPQEADGGYCGYNPADGAEAVRMLEALRLGGSEYLVIPAAAFWWLDYYAELRDYLERSPESALYVDADCRIYKLPAITSSGPT